MNNLKYNKLIVLDRKQNGDWRLLTDRGDMMLTSFYPTTQYQIWRSSQCQSLLRQWQIDVMIKPAADIWGKLVLFAAYRKGNGFNQNHDVCLIKTQQQDIWLLSTQRDLWICQNSGNNIEFITDMSIGNVDDYVNISTEKTVKHNRLEIYDIFEKLKVKFNPSNLMQVNEW